MKRPKKIEHTFNEKDEFYNYLRKRHENRDFVGSNVIELKHLSFQFHIMIPFSFSPNKEKNLSNFLISCEYQFKECEFNSCTTIKTTRRQVFFENNCWFNEQLRVESREINLTFKNCEINDLNLAESTFGNKNSSSGKLRIKSSEVNKTNFKNTTFYALVDFYYTTFNENVIFYKTDFYNIVVLSATTFVKNLLFTYTLLNDKVIMRATIFEKGFDFSLAIIKGHLAIFDLNHSYKNYHSMDGLKQEKEYEKAVSYDGLIPTQNKLETYRLLKVEFESQKNIPEYLNFKLYEKKAFKKILAKKDTSWKNRFDRATLWLNGISNNHGTSYSKAFIFIVLVGWFFFYISLIATDSYEFSYNIFEWEFSKGLGYFMQFLLPTHKFNYMGLDNSLNAGFYFFDFLGRIFVGYGIYQFIQAFRKYK
jgi:hypothetical protein